MHLTGEGCTVPFTISSFTQEMPGQITPLDPPVQCPASEGGQHCCLRARNSDVANYRISCPQRNFFLTSPAPHTQRLAYALFISLTTHSLTNHRSSHTWFSFLRGWFPIYHQPTCVLPRGGRVGYTQRQQTCCMLHTHLHR